MILALFSPAPPPPVTMSEGRVSGAEVLSNLFQIVSARLNDDSSLQQFLELALGDHLLRSL